MVTLLYQVIRIGMGGVCPEDVTVAQEYLLSEMPFLEFHNCYDFPILDQSGEYLIHRQIALSFRCDMERLEFNILTVIIDDYLTLASVEYIVERLIENYPFLEHHTNAIIDNMTQIVFNINDREYQKFKLLGGKINYAFYAKLPFYPEIVQVFIDR